MHARPHPRRLTPLRLLLLDDCELVNLGLAELLAPFPSRVRLQQAGPGVDAVLVDPFATPDGFELLRRAADTAPVVVAWSWTEDPEGVAAALRSGAHGFLIKTLPADALVDALEQIARPVPRRTEDVAGADGASTVVALEPADLAPHAPSARREPLLTVREREVVERVARGLSNQQVADELFLSLNTVKSYIRSAYRKMGVSSRSQAVRWAFEHGLGAAAATPEPDTADEPAHGLSPWSPWSRSPARSAADPGRRAGSSAAW